jgi:hypothetical protein
MATHAARGCEEPIHFLRDLGLQRVEAWETGIGSSRDGWRIRYAGRQVDVTIDYLDWQFDVVFERTGPGGRLPVPGSRALRSSQGLHGNMLPPEVAEGGRGGARTSGGLPGRETTAPLRMLRSERQPTPSVTENDRGTQAQCGAILSAASDPRVAVLLLAGACSDGNSPSPSPARSRAGGTILRRGPALRLAGGRGPA